MVLVVVVLKSQIATMFSTRSIAMSIKITIAMPIVNIELISNKTKTKQNKNKITHI